MADVSKKEQLSIVLRYVLKGGVYERFLGFTAAEGLDAASLFSYIRKAITEHGISLKQCMGQCYDDAAVMSGSCSGVQAKKMEEAPSAALLCSSSKSSARSFGQTVFCSRGLFFAL